jgi:ATP-dependent Clp protease adaptor protein ClpS
MRRTLFRAGILGQNGRVPTAAPDTLERVREDTRERVVEDEAVSPEFPWVTIVWDDPINLMSYVTGTREEMERDVTRLHSAGLWATLQHDR